MRKSSSSGAQAKVFYRPIEAAIQWAGLSVVVNPSRTVG